MKLVFVNDLKTSLKFRDGLNAGIAPESWGQKVVFPKDAVAEKGWYWINHTSYAKTGMFGDVYCIPSNGEMPVGVSSIKNFRQGWNGNSFCIKELQFA